MFLHYWGHRYLLSHFWDTRRRAREGVLSSESLPQRSVSSSPPHEHHTLLFLPSIEWFILHFILVSAWCVCARMPVCLQTPSTLCMCVHACPAPISLSASSHQLCFMFVMCMLWWSYYYYLFVEAFVMLLLVHLWIILIPGIGESRFEFISENPASCSPVMHSSSLYLYINIKFSWYLKEC